jgi:hypothetical protein
MTFAKWWSAKGTGLELVGASIKSATKLAYDDALKEKSNEVKHWKKLLGLFGGYVCSCKTNNTTEYMDTLAEWLTKISHELGDNDKFLVNGDDFIIRKVR